MDEGKCGYCGELILWAKLAPALRPHPLDPVPRPEGTIEVSRGVYSPTWYARIFPQHSKTPRPARLYVSHFATCKNRPRKKRPVDAVREIKRQLEMGDDDE